MSDVLIEILSRLPVEPLLRFRCVCKQWLNLIDSPIFIKSHLNHSQKTNSNRTLIFARYKIDSFNLDSLDSATKRLKSPFERYHDPLISILGSCNGIICLYNLMGSCVNNPIFFWNPTTQNLHQTKLLPGTECNLIDMHNSKKGILGHSSNLFGFGYDHLNDDYKLIRIHQGFWQNGDSAELDIEIYSLKSNSWRRIRHFPYYFLKDKHYDTLVGGALHWVVRSKCNDKVHFIAAFDLGIEEFRLVQLPDYLIKDRKTSVGVLGGCLSVVYSLYTCDYTKFDIWVMKIYGMKESWTKLVSIGDRSSPFRSLRAVAYSKTGDKLFLKQDGNEFVWYDLGNKTFEKINVRGVCDFCDVIICLGSLVQVSGGGSNVN